MTRFTVTTSIVDSRNRKAVNPLISDLNGEYTLTELLEHTKASLILISDQVLREEQAAGFDKKPIIAVDRVVGRPLQVVQPLGQVEFTARAQVSDILFATYEAILYRSKVLTGRYKSSNYVFLNGTQVATSMRELEVWFAFAAPAFKQSDIIRFVNIQPYARKLERAGITAQRSKIRKVTGNKKGKHAGKLLEVPNGTYYLTARAIKAKYKRNSGIRFSFISGASLGLSGVFQKAGRKGKNSAGRPYLYPSITISVSEEGTK